MIESKYPNSGILLAGDFNRLNINRLLKHFHLKQLVKAPTRNDAILDLVLTNLHEYYLSPEILPPFSLSDHNNVIVRPLAKSQKPNKRIVIRKRDHRQSRKAELGRYLSSIDWYSIISIQNNCEEMWNIFYDVVSSGLELLMPSKEVKISTTDVPWMNNKLKSLIKKRQQAFITHGSKSTMFKQYRNLVNRERKLCRAKYYELNIHKLKEKNPKKWWSEVKRVSNFSTKREPISLNNVEAFSNLTQMERADKINAAFLEPLEEYRLQSPLPIFPLEEMSTFPNVSEMRVQKILSNLPTNRASGPDKLPNWILKEYSYVLALPVSLILNASYREQCVPTTWKMADIIPLPKTKIIKNLKKDLRPISLTASISKVAKEFIVADYVTPAVLKVIDQNQYGAIPNSSTTTASISMIHRWSNATDGNGAVVRSILFDYRKAFDFIDHSILIQKLSELEIPNSVINWISDFLTNRYQRVKLADTCYSEWGPIPSGVPQGTKLGPWLFVLPINDLEVARADLWKYIDDSTVSEIVPKDSISKAQSITDDVVSWSKDNRMQLNPDKCKGLRISFNIQPRPFDPIVIDGKELEVVTNVKLLGLTINNKLSWKPHIDEVVKKVDKRLYFLKQLKRANVPCKDLATFYTSCVRSVMDYAIPVFYYALPQYLHSDLERLERRAMAIIMPEENYSDTLNLLGIPSLDDHHEHLRDNLFKSVVFDSNNKLHNLLPGKNEPSYSLRNERTFNIPMTHTKRVEKSFI